MTPVGFSNTKCLAASSCGVDRRLDGIEEGDGDWFAAFGLGSLAHDPHLYLLYVRLQA